MAEPVPAIRQLSLDGLHGGTVAVRLTPAGPASRISLRARAEDVQVLSASLGVALPQKPKSSASSKGLMALWLGPDEWLVIDEPDADLVGACSQSGAVHSATDISHRNVAVIVSGPGAENTLNAGCPQDLSLSAFPAGACSRTLLGKVEIVLLRVDEDTFRVEFWRSFSDYVFAFLTEAAADSAA